MQTVGSFLDDLSMRIPPSGAAGWDVEGLQLGDPSRLLETVAVCHEVTDEVVSTLARHPADLVVAYHPLLFRPTTRVVAGRGPSGRAFRLLTTGTALAVAHTSFDAAPGGTADALAESLGLRQPVPFGPTDPAEQVKIVTFAPSGSVDSIAAAMAAAGAGVIGAYTECSFRIEGTGSFRAGDMASPVVGAAGEFHSGDETRLEMIAPAGVGDAVVAALVSAHPYDEPPFDVFGVVSNTGFIGRVGGWAGTLGELADLVVDRLGGDGLRLAGESEQPVASVAVVPGSGSDFVGAAAQMGAQAIVTGDVSHHQMIAALDRGVAVADPGHAPTERPGMARLAAVVTECAAEGVEVVDLTYADPTPWR